MLSTQDSDTIGLIINSKSCYGIEMKHSGKEEIEISVMWSGMLRYA